MAKNPRVVHEYCIKLDTPLLAPLPNPNTGARVSLKLLGLNTPARIHRKNLYDQQGLAVYVSLRVCYLNYVSFTFIRSSIVFLSDKIHIRLLSGACPTSMTI